jgi:hypothetical protein
MLLDRCGVANSDAKCQAGLLSSARAHHGDRVRSAVHDGVADRAERLPGKSVAVAGSHDEQLRGRGVGSRICAVRFPR